MGEVPQFQLKKKSQSTAPANSGNYKGKTILSTKKKDDRLLAIIEDGKDLTPKTLNPDIFAGAKERQLSVFEVTPLDRTDATTSGSLNIFKSQSTAKFKTGLERQQLEQSTVQIKGSFNYNNSNYLDVFILDSSASEGSAASDIETLGTNSDEFTVIDEDMAKMPKQISLLLSETNTVILLDIPSSTVLKDTDEGNLVEEQNEQYEYLTVGKGRNRKVLHAEVQTVTVLKKSRNTDPEKIKKRSDYSFASNWEMYDTYVEAAEGAGEDSEESEASEAELHKLDDTSSVDSYRISVDEKQLTKLVQNPRFQDAVCVIERLLSNNSFSEEQKRFIGLSDPDVFREEIEYKYNLNLLWTFANEDTKGKSVNTLHWNPVNKHILAVGYGKFYFQDNIPGLVHIWNIKNPVQPERQYWFDDSVTSLCFSKSDPNLLAVGLYNGSVMVLNVISREKCIVGENMPTFEPVWDMSWAKAPYEITKREQVRAAFSDGRVCVYSVATRLMEQVIMRTPKADGKLKGYDTMRKCSNLMIPVSRYSGALFVTPHPTEESIYYIGTREGVIHKCSKTYFNQHLDHFLAHDGPVYVMKFSPFSENIFATSGDDWHARIWAEDIAEPIFTLSSETILRSVQGLDWSPTHSTILVTIRASTILIWDFQRKIYEPQSVTPSPSGVQNTIVQFIDTGRCLVVGDIEGYVHVFSLEDMPFSPFFQENLLFDSLFRALITNPVLLHKLKKVRRSKQFEASNSQ